MHSSYQITVLVNNLRFRKTLTIKKVKDLARRLFLYILKLKIEFLGVAKHCLMQVVNEFTSSLCNLTREEVSKREAAATASVVSIVESCVDTVLPEFVSASESRQTSPDDGNINVRTRRRRCRCASYGR